jgi:hypothetical protein
MELRQSTGKGGKDNGNSTKTDEKKKKMDFCFLGGEHAACCIKTEAE